MNPTEFNEGVEGAGERVGGGLPARAEERREEMLDLLQGRLQRRVVRRRMVRSLGACGLLLLLGAGGLWLASLRGVQVAPRTETVAAKGSSGAEAPAGDGAQVKDVRQGTEVARVTVTRVGDEAGIVRRLAIRPQGGDVARISDDELRGLLRSAGVDTGIVRIQGKVLLAKDVASAKSGDGGNPSSLRSPEMETQGGRRNQG